MDATDAAELISSKSVLGVTIVDLLFNVINVAPLLYLLVRMTNTKMMHRNLRGLMVLLTVALICFNLGSLWRNILYLLLSIFNFVKSVSRIYSASCWLARAVYDTAAFMLAFTMIGMALERILATVLVRDYETRERRTLGNLIFAFMICASVALSLFFAVLDLVGAIWLDGVPQLTCSLIMFHPSVLLLAYCVGAIGCFAFALILLYLFYYNQREYRKLGVRDLQTRYQLAENVVTLRLLMPIIFLFALLYSASFAIDVHMSNRIGSSSLTKSIVKEMWLFERLNSLPGSIYTALYCLLFFALHAPLRNKLIDDVKRLTGQSDSHMHSDNKKHVVGVHGQKMQVNIGHDAHFKSLQDDWNLHLPKDAKKVANSAQGKSKR